MKVYAMYLPQFHRTPENDLWWGNGFTEWTAVKKAEKLYEEHEQPRIPQGQYYYNLLEKNTMEWQSCLMKKYGVDGLCMYHYWFKDGMRILEKPAENLLSWKDIDMPFCFCWANETWARTWSNIQNKNTWSDIYEPKKQTMSKDVLLEQKYGKEEQWKKHFEYLLPFFLDERYIKVERKPLFLIYKVDDIPCLPEMLDCWKKLACTYGLDGIYVVGEGHPRKDCLDASICYQPAGSFRKLSDKCSYKENGLTIWGYDDVWEKILSERPVKKTFFVGIKGYDDTPRRGCGGNVIEHITPEKFSYYMTELMAKSAAYGNDIVFVNAWNEWGEGMYLEPDEKYGGKFLQALLYAKDHYEGQIGKYKDAGLQKTTEDIEKDLHYYNLLDDWMWLRDNGISIADWLLRTGYKRVAIYGFGRLGKHLYRELYNSQVEVGYIIDKTGNKIHTDVSAYLPSDTLPEIDAVIVSATYYFREIYQVLKEKRIKKIISLETILREIKFTE